VIQSLRDAWDWYKAVKTLVKMMDRVAGRYWSEEVGKKTLEETLHKDNAFKDYEASKIRDLASLVTNHLDDLAVLLLFSVFESTVRDRTLNEMKRELPVAPRHPALQKALADARDAIEHGSFGRITETYKSSDPNLKTLVDQVRKYRNWVAHGRRGTPENNVGPDGALKRLEDFLQLLDATAPNSPPIGSDDQLPESRDSGSLGAGQGPV
jgi:hypothetical protein